jgi:hypothetical protein
MDRVSIDLENCYGIKKLQKKLDFSKHAVYALYAPNGLMKTSLAQTFLDISNGQASQDRIFPDRVTVRNIADENGVALTSESVFVVCPYDAQFAHTEKTSTLLVDLKLKKEYDQLHVGIDNAKEVLLKALKEQSHSKKDFEAEIASAFTSDDDFFKALIRIKKELLDQKETPFADILYDRIFDDKVLSFIGTKDVKTALEGYIQRYNELLAASTFFKKGTFDYYNAAQIAKSLADNGFFDAKHTVQLNAAGANGAKEQLEISTQEELEDVITKEKEAIIKDKALRKKFDDVEKLITKNVTLRDFKDYMVEHEPLLSQLVNVKKFKEDILKSYLKVKIDLYQDLMNKYEDAEKRTREIEQEAAKQSTQWEEVIQIFNERFVVPFTLSATNKIPVMLGHAPMIELEFIYHDGTDDIEIEKDELLKVLSTGERKALYVLNIIFEVQVRKKANQETLVVIDDIADSFDYQNKYAIIQYLMDIDEDKLFKQVIMTHNFDFFRTLESRFVPYSHCLMAVKNGSKVTLEQAAGIRNVFLLDWKGEFKTNLKKKIACISFLRNLIEIMEGSSTVSFVKLTSLLHWRNDSAAITVADLDTIYNDMFGETSMSANGTTPMVEIIRAEAQSCMTAAVGINLENKIVLAIAIRMAAEQFMVKKINDPVFWAAIKSKQTQVLLGKFKKLFAKEIDSIGILDRVALMTPENIHLNSFMYEPIVDMSDEHLRKLYADVLALK